MFRKIFNKQAVKATTFAQRKFANNCIVRNSVPSATESAQPSQYVKKDITSPPFVRLHDTLPSNLRSQFKEGDQDFEVLVTIPSNFERATGTERAEILDPHVWDDLLPTVIDTTTGVGSSAFNPIIIPSHGESERVVGCPGECWGGNQIDFDGVDWQYWVMKENQFGMCDECGLVFFLASPHVIAQMELWGQLEEEWKTEEQLSNETATVELDASEKFESLEAEDASVHAEAKQLKH